MKASRPWRASALLASRALCAPPAPPAHASAAWPAAGTRNLAAAAALVALLAGACRSLPAPVPADEAQAGARIAEFAASLIGAPYQFGGADAAGFDCSGLARYVHERAGLVIPRTAAEQQRVARRVPLAQLSPGDLVFFRIRRHAVDHVGVYTGGGRFVHAPRRGEPVTYGDLSRGFYARHLVSAGRFWDRHASQRSAP